ncbi:MAG: ABC transporter substrate-binding protein [Acidimicrobiia bacterium]|nr:ABC transporter substrate-binding protein [Acidimicrobiia bacterium]
MRQITRALVLFIALAMIATACGDDTSDDTTTTTAGDTGQATTTTAPDAATTTTTAGEPMEPYLFAASLPLTGDFAIPGSKHNDGYAFCVEEINRLGGLDGHQVQYLGDDNQSTPEQTVAQIQRHIDVEGADVLLGTFSSLLTFPASTEALNAGMVYPVPSGGALRIWERGYDNIFYFQQNAAELIGFSPLAMIEYYVEQGIIDETPASVAIVDADDFFASAIVTGLVGGDVRLPGGGDVIAQVPGFLNDPRFSATEVVFQETWPIPFTDWITLANGMKNSGAEMVFAATASPDETISLVNAMATVDYQPKLVWMSQGAQSEFRDTLAGNEQHITVHASWHPLANYASTLAGQDYTNQDFIDGFTASFGRPPDEDEAIPFAVCQGMSQAILGAGSADNAAMKDWLRARTADDPVTSVLGDFYWDDRGLPIERSHIMVQWQDGELVFVYPVGDFPGTVDLVFPKADFE